MGIACSSTHLVEKALIITIAACAITSVETPSIAGPRRNAKLEAWIHPVTDARELVPSQPQRRFGARRDGHKGRRDCHRGHCGVDLDGPRGRPIVAVAPGTVVVIDNHRNGKDGKSGRYVRIEHPDSLFTSYMHLDAIAPGLAVGDVVEAGQVIGRLGKGGIHHGEAHLHFQLERGSRFLDPTPYLARARVVPIPGRTDGATDPGDRAQW